MTAGRHTDWRPPEPPLHSAVPRSVSYSQITNIRGQDIYQDILLSQFFSPPEPQEEGWGCKAAGPWARRDVETKGTGFMSPSKERNLSGVPQTDLHLHRKRKRFPKNPSLWAKLCCLCRVQGQQRAGTERGHFWGSWWQRLRHAGLQRNAGHLRHQILPSNEIAGWLSRENVTIQTVIWPAQWI